METNNQDQKNHPVWDVYNLLRTSRLNIKYYSHKLNSLKRFNFLLEIMLAIGAPSSAIASFYYWNTTHGAIIWNWILGFTALIALIKPFLKLSDKIGAYEKTVQGYRILEHQIDKIKIQIKQDKYYSDKHRTLLEVAVEMEGKLKENGPDLIENKRLKRNCEKEVLRELPAKDFYIPKEDK